MPRNGGGVYALPNTYEAVSGETIEAQQHNAPLEDLQQDANTARPIVAGGTGGTSAIESADNLSTKSSNIASATTTDLSTATGTLVHITGTTTITGFGTCAAGVERTVVFDGALTLTHNGTSLVLPGAANIVTTAGDTATFRSEGSGNWRCILYQRVSGRSIAAEAGYISGLILSNNVTDATNDIDIATGAAASDDASPVLITLASALVKRMDANWTVGTNQGGLDTGSASNAIYFVWVIRRPDTGVTDVLLSLSSTSPTMPANYTQKALAGTFARVGGVNQAPRSYGEGDVTPWVAYTPTFVGLGTVTGIGYVSRRVGDTLEIMGRHVSGTPTATQVRVTLGFKGVNANVTSADSSKIPVTGMLCGTAAFSTNFAGSGTVLIPQSAGYLNFGLQGATTNGGLALTGDVYASNGVAITHFARVPIQGWDRP